MGAPHDALYESWEAGGKVLIVVTGLMAISPQAYIYVHLPCFTSLDMFQCLLVCSLWELE